MVVEGGLVDAEAAKERGRAAGLKIRRERTELRKPIQRRWRVVNASLLEDGDVVADRGLVHRTRNDGAEVMVISGDPKEVYYYQPTDQVFAFVKIP